MNTMNNPAMFEALPSYDESIPTYDESVSRSPQPHAYLPVLEQVQSPILSDTSSITSSNLPPAFSTSPVTLILCPNSTLIRPLFSSDDRALYELTSPLNGYNRSVFLAEIPTISRLDNRGHLPQIEKRHHLYKIFEAQEGGKGGLKYTAVDGRKTRCMQGTMLRRSSDGSALVATNHGDTWGSRGDLIYCARLNEGVIEWSDSKGKVVAIDHMAIDRRSQERLEVLVPLNKKWLDMLVAVWISRIHQDTQREGDEERREARARAGRQQGLLNGMRGKLGIGYRGRNSGLGGSSSSPPIYA